MKTFYIWTVLVYVLVYPLPVDQKFVKAGSTSTENFISKLEKDRFEDKEFVQDVLKNVDGNNIRKFLKELSRKPHLAASKRDKELVTWIKSQWKQARKAHSSAFCIDLHRQTLMTMMDNDDNDGQ